MDSSVTAIISFVSVHMRRIQFTLSVDLANFKRQSHTGRRARVRAWPFRASRFFLFFQNGNCSSNLYLKLIVIATPKTAGEKVAVL